MQGSAFAEKKFIEIKGRKMAYIDEGEGAPIVFQHGNPTSSYLWRKVMPECVGLGRLIACDLIGMGDSDKLPDSGPGRYTYVEQREYLFALWEELGLTRDVVLVIHDWGSTLGFDWASQHPDRVQGIAYMEAAPLPLTWSDFPEYAQDGFKASRTPAGEDMVLRDNNFIEGFLIAAEKGNLSAADEAEYRRPFLNPGEDRRAILSWARQISLDGSPANVTQIMTDISEWLSHSPVPKLWRKATLALSQTADLQESSGPEVGKALAKFVRSLRDK